MKLAAGIAALSLAPWSVSAKSGGSRHETEPGSRLPSDKAVIAAVVEHLLNDDGKGSPLTAEARSKLIRLSALPARFALELRHALPNFGEGPWTELSWAERDALHEAAKDLVGRSDKPNAEFEVSNSRVQLFRGEDHGGNIFHPAFEAFAPGYSQNGRHSIVLLNLLGTAHGAEGLYWLMSQDGTWKVRVRQFFYRK